MVINEKKPKEPERESERELKERLLREISEQSVGVIALAHVYATNFESMGVDLARAWATMEQQTRALEAAYKKGVDDTIIRLRSEGKLTNKRDEKRRERELQREEFLKNKREGGKK